MSLPIIAASMREDLARAQGDDLRALIYGASKVGDTLTLVLAGNGPTIYAHVEPDGSMVFHAITWGSAAGRLTFPANPDFARIWREYHPTAHVE